MTIETCPICGSDLLDLMICTYPPIPAKVCTSCDWRWEDEKECIKRIQLDVNKYKDNLIRNAIEYNSAQPNIKII